LLSSAHAFELIGLAYFLGGKVMSRRRQFPQVLDWEPTSTERYFLMVGMKCGTCGHELGKDEKFWRRETQVSYMRGEDEVEIKCCACKDKDVTRPSDTRERR
jgi:hypothetical protein